MRQTIYIYRDQGVGAFSYKALLRSLKKSSILQSYALKTLLAKELLEGSWQKECALLLFPGGADTPYHELLKGAGTSLIRSYVEEGGAFFGICAGAYFASREVVFEVGTLNEIRGERELGFFPGQACGTLEHLGSYSYEKHLSASPEEISYEGSSLYTYYNGGCAFLKAEDYPHVKVLSKYLGGKEKLAALLKCDVGKGRVVLSGVHIEVQAELCKREEILYSKIQQTEEKRALFFDQLLLFLLQGASER